MNFSIIPTFNELNVPSIKTEELEKLKADVSEILSMRAKQVGRLIRPNDIVFVNHRIFPITEEFKVLKINIKKARLQRISDNHVFTVPFSMIKLKS